MIKNYIGCGSADRDRIGLKGTTLLLERCCWLVSGPATQMTDHDIVGADREIVILEADPTAGGGLTGDRAEGLAELERFLKRNDPRHAKENVAWPFRFNSRAQAARAGVVQVFNKEYASATAPWRVGTEAFGTREGGGDGFRGAETN
jgi:hypothetical protein